MTYHWVIPLVAASATLVLATLVFSRASSTRVGRIFALLSCSLVLWNLNFFILYLVSDGELAFQLTRFCRMGSVFVPVGILHLSFAFREGRSRIWALVLVADYAWAFVLAVANYYDLMVSGLQPFTFGFYSVSGPWYWGYTFAVLVNFLLAAGLVLHDYRTTDEPRLRVQLKFWALGMAIALPLGLTNLLPAYGVPVYPLGNLGNAVWAGIVGYAIVRHRLMDVDLVLSKSVAFVATGLVVIIPAFVLSLLMQNRVFGHVQYDFSFALLAMFVAIGLFFPTLRLRTEAQIERSFFREKHEYRSVLASLTKSIIRILDRDQLIRELGEKLSSTLRVDRVSFFVRDDDRDPVRLQHAVGIPPAQNELAVTHALIKVLSAGSEPILRDEAKFRTSAQWQQIERTFAENGWELCVPLAAGGRLIGFVGIGRKRNLDVFSVVDLDLLGTLAAQAAIAYENARLYAELHRSKDLIQRAGRMSALGTLAAGIAHEIRNPLVSIQTFFQLAPERLHDQEFVTSFLQLADTEVRRIGDLVTELLTFARPHGEVVQDIDLGDTIDRTLRLLAPQAHRQRIRLEREGMVRPLVVKCDPDRIKQVLINIILNAIQATPDGGAVTLCDRTVDRNGHAFCQIEVRDTGTGIPPSIQEDMFNPFFTTKDKGTGLGLSIAHQIIAEHGGFITVESRQGEGSRFLIHLQLLEEAVQGNIAREVSQTLTLR